MSNTVPGQSRVQAVRNFKSWLEWAFILGGAPKNYEDSVRYAIERGQELVLTEEEMAPMHQFLAKKAL